MSMIKQAAKKSGFLGKLKDAIPKKRNLSRKQFNRMRNPDVKTPLKDKLQVLRHRGVKGGKRYLKENQWGR